MEGSIRYRCRRCGEEFADGTVPDLGLAMGTLVTETSFPAGWRHPPGVETIHECSPGKWGRADWWGGDEILRPEKTHGG